MGINDFPMTPPKSEQDIKIENLAATLRRMIWLARKEAGDTALKAFAGKAEELLRKYGLQGSPLRGS